MLTCCEDGDVVRLQQLFKAAGVQSGDPQVHMGCISRPNGYDDIPAVGPPPTLHLFQRAIEHKQPRIILFLIHIYPDFDLESRWVLDVAFRNPDLETFGVLHASCPGIINHQGTQHPDTSLTMALKLNHDPLLPIYLLDHGADPNPGGFGDIGALYCAVEGGHRLRIISKIVEAGGLLKPITVVSAVTKRNAELVEFFIDGCVCTDRDGMLEWSLSEACKVEDDRLIDMLEKRIRKRGQRKVKDERQVHREEKTLARAKAESLEAWEEEITGKRKRWWQCWP